MDTHLPVLSSLRTRAATSSQSNYGATRSSGSSRTKLESNAAEPNRFMRQGDSFALTFVSMTHKLDLLNLGAFGLQRTIAFLRGSDPQFNLCSSEL
ncbi:hypothetical protein K443DRAFT_196873 [Laccaria amethystina LaAM-08-1]|uniref:Uncharacterized protein n=1 Tax=Laccaria amethystina LaAM-08-1 TaxID=1095629 RepID=A0A0C9XS63_9AGAR|nr:hypothetical protein K443DRAFT_196873 [Laccaria amethystina LaAM-08-1]